MLFPPSHEFGSSSLDSSLPPGTAPRPPLGAQSEHPNLQGYRLPAHRQQGMPLYPVAEVDELSRSNISNNERSQELLDGADGYATQERAHGCAHRQESAHGCAQHGRRSRPGSASSEEWTDRPPLRGMERSLPLGEVHCPARPESMALLCSTPGQAERQLSEFSDSPDALERGSTPGLDTLVR